MFGNENGMKEMILQKILELFESLPDQDEPKAENPEASAEAPVLGSEDKGLL